MVNYGVIVIFNAPVAQLDRVPDYESGGHKFESCRAHQLDEEAISAKSWNGFFISYRTLGASKTRFESIFSRKSRFSSAVRDIHNVFALVASSKTFFAVVR